MLIRADVVVGEDLTETTIDHTLIMDLPTTKIADVRARIAEIECEVSEGQVMIAGMLHKQIFYVGPEQRVYHQAEDVMFSAVASVPGAVAGMHCQVHPNIISLEHRLIGPLPTTEVRQRVGITFFVKVTESQQLDVILGTTGPLYRVRRVIGEETTAAVVESAVELTYPAEKVRAVRAIMGEYSATAAEDQIIMEGLVHKQIFYICAFDQMEYHQAEDVPFTVVVPMEGVQAGEDVEADMRVTRVSWTLNGSRLQQRVAMSCFMKVTDTAQTMLCTAPEGPLVKVGRVAGENTRQTIVEDQVCLDVPAKKVQDILAVITDLETEVISGKVIIEGTIHKQIFYVGPNDIVRHYGVDVPFSTFVDVPGAEPGMTVQVHPRIEHMSWDLIRETPDCPLPEYYEPPYEDLYRVIQERVVIEVFAKVTEMVQVNVCLNNGPPVS